MKRRHFLSITAVGAATLPWTAHAGTSQEPDELSLLATPRLLEIVRDPGAVAAIGERYRRATPAEGNVDALVRALLVDARVDLRAAAVARAKIRDALEERVRRDFAEDRTVILNGWVLARTEARQCALYSLLAA